MAKDFTLSGYDALLTAFRERDYKSAMYDNVVPGAKEVLLRHDIDMSIEAAVATAQIEADASMRATYFVLLRSEFYNPFAPASKAGLNEIAQLGHDIGLHFDAALYEHDLAALNRAAEEECAVLETLLGRTVSVISFHRPAKALLGLEQPIARRVHAYQPKYFSEMGYCSDSRGAWHYGHPLEHECVRDGRALQLLTHPLWWTGGGIEPHGRVAQFAEARANLIKRELAENCTSYTLPKDLGSCDVVRGD
jgi:hypothetical protein